MDQIVHDHKGLIDLIIMISISLVVVTFFRRLNVSSVLGYLTVGGIIGVNGFNLVQDSESAAYLGEFGVVFLLFATGLELTFARLIHMRRQVFGFGSLQVVLCGLILGGITYFLSGDINISFVVGFVFALSSTAIVLQVLADRGEEVTQYGRLSVANLILQDLAFVPMLIMIPILAEGDTDILHAALESLAQGAVAIVVVIIFGKKFVGPIYRGVAMLHSQELFIALTLLIVLSSAYLTQHYGLSLALGAFIAGLIVAETEYRTQVETDLKPFKGLLMGLFFITVGMQIDYHLILDQYEMILILTSSIIIIKSLVIYFLARVFGFGKSCSLKAGVTLSQASEFAFVLLGIALLNGIISGELSQIFVATVSISMAVTPLLASVADKVSKRIDMKNPVHFEDRDIEAETSDLTGHIIVVGYDRIGRTTCDLLKYKDIGYVALDDSPAEVHRARKEGEPIYFGQCSRLENVEKLGLERAEIVAITLSHKTQVNSLVKAIKEKYPNVKVVVRAKDRLHADYLKSQGADITIAEAFESSLMIGNFVLTSVGVSDSEVEDAIDNFRKKEHPNSQLKGVLYKAKEDFSSI